MTTQYPVIRNWREIVAYEDSRGFIVGEVENHHSIDDGWMTTSQVQNIDMENGILTTQNSTYLLRNQLPSDALLPAGAIDAVFNMALTNTTARMGVLSLEIVEMLSNEVTRICGPAASPNEKP